MMSYAETILAIAKTMKVSGPLLLAICTHETGLKNVIVEQDGDSPTYGVCQIKLETAKMLGYKESDGSLMVPEINIRWAAKYLKYQESRYGDNWCKIVSAYNSGSYNESKSLKGKPRNLAYVQHVKDKLNKDLQHKLSCEPLTDVEWEKELY